MGHPTHSYLLLFSDPWVPSGVTDLCAMSLWTSLPFITKCGLQTWWVSLCGSSDHNELALSLRKDLWDIIRLVKTSCRDQIFIVNFFYLPTSYSVLNSANASPPSTSRGQRAPVYISVFGSGRQINVMYYYIFFYVACWIYKDWVCNVHRRVKHKTDIRICASRDMGRRRKWKQKLSYVAGQMF